MKKNFSSLAFSLLIFLFAIGPIFEYFGVADYIIWRLILVCIIIAFCCTVYQLIKDRRSFIAQLTSRNLFYYLDIIWSALGLIISLYFNTYLYGFWTALFCISIIDLFISYYSKKRKRNK